MRKNFQKAITYIKEGNIKKAQLYFSDLQKKAPNNPVILERLAFCFAKQEKWELSEKYYSRSSALIPNNSEMLNNYGCVVQKQNRWGEAAKLFEKSYKLNKNNISALVNLALTLKNDHSYSEALKYYRLAIDKVPNNAQLRFDCAEILHHLTFYDEEIRIYLGILSTEPNNPKAHIMLAIALFADGQEDKAFEQIIKTQKQYEQTWSSLFTWADSAQKANNYRDSAIGFGLLTSLIEDDPRFWKAYALNSYIAHGFQSSLPILLKSIDLFPRDKDLRNLITTIYCQAGEVHKALESAQIILKLGQDDANSFETFASVLWQYQRTYQTWERTEEVCENFIKAIDLAKDERQVLQTISQSLIATKEPYIIQTCLNNLPETLKHSFLDNILHSFLSVHKKDFQTAISFAKRACQQEPENSFAPCELADIYFRCEAYDLAADTCRKALEKNVGDSEAFMRHGHILVDCGYVEEGLKSSEKAHLINPNDPSITFSLGLINLLICNWSAGWKYYESRFRMRHISPFEIPPIPRWDGKPCDTLILFSEQGLGDVIQFSRFLPEASAQVGKLIFKVKNKLHHLFEHYSDIADIISENESITFDPETMRWASILDIPHLLGLPEKRWALNVPYLKVNEDKLRTWSRKIRSDGFKVGITWQGNPEQRIDVGRSIPLKYFEPLSQIEGIRLINLQKYHGLEQMEQISFRDMIESPGTQFDEGSDAFVDSIAIIKSLDLVITSDTSIAHLAGALGCPVWLGLKHVPDWRWQLHRDDSPWYPSMRLFRQKRPGDWSSVLYDMSGEIRKVLTSGMTSHTHTHV